MADFSHVQQVETQLSECESHRKAVVQIKVAGAAEPLLITCLSSEMAESIADLVDRYCRLVNGTNVSLWNKRGIDSFFLVVSCCFLLFLVVSCCFLFACQPLPLSYWLRSLIALFPVAISQNMIRITLNLMIIFTVKFTQRYSRPDEYPTNDVSVLSHYLSFSFEILRMLMLSR